MVDDYMIDKVLKKIREIIGIEKFDHTRILINMDDKLSDDITLKRVMILMTCVIEDGNKYYPQLLLDHALYNEQTQHKSSKKDISKELMLEAWHLTRW